MTGGFVDLFRHNTWANLQLIDVCSNLTPDQMAVTVDGTYGNIKDTLVHIVGAEEGYLSRLTGERPRPELQEDEWPGIEELRARAAESGARLEADSTADVERMLDWVSEYDGMHRRVQASLVLTQSINHSTEHRGHVMTVLTQAGVEPPEVDGWAYARWTGQLTEEEP